MAFVRQAPALDAMILQYTTEAGYLQAAAGMHSDAKIGPHSYTHLPSGYLKQLLLVHVERQADAIKSRDAPQGQGSPLGLHNDFVEAILLHCLRNPGYVLCACDSLPSKTPSHNTTLRTERQGVDTARLFRFPQQLRCTQFLMPTRSQPRPDHRFCLNNHLLPCRWPFLLLSAARVLCFTQQLQRSSSHRRRRLLQRF